MLYTCSPFTPSLCSLHDHGKHYYDKLSGLIESKAKATHFVIIVLFMECLDTVGGLQQEEGVKKKLAVSAYMFHNCIHNYAPILSECVNTVVGLFSV